MRTPPVCRSRLVGLLIRSDFAGSSRSTSTASVTPNASMSSGAAVASGKCSRVADATPSSVWQPRHCAASKIGYSVRENEIGPATACCAAARGDVVTPRKTATRTADAQREARALALMLRSGAERDARRGPRAPRDERRRMIGAERRDGVSGHVRVIQVQTAQAPQLREALQRGVADRRVRDVEARQARERGERRRGRIVEPLHVPEAQAPKLVERRERPDARPRDRGAADVEPTQLL